MREIVFMWVAAIASFVFGYFVGRVSKRDQRDWANEPMTKREADEYEQTLARQRARKAPGAASEPGQMSPRWPPVDYSAKEFRPPHVPGAASEPYLNPGSTAAAHAGETLQEAVERVNRDFHTAVERVNRMRDDGSDPKDDFDTSALIAKRKARADAMANDQRGLYGSPRLPPADEARIVSELWPSDVAPHNSVGYQQELRENVERITKDWPEAYRPDLTAKPER